MVGHAQWGPMSAAGVVPYHFQTPVAASQISISYSRIGEPPLSTGNSQSRVTESLVFFQIPTLRGSPGGSV